MARGQVALRAQAAALPLAALLGCARAGDPPVPAVRPEATASRCVATPAPESRFVVGVLGSGGPTAAGRAASSYVVFIDGVARVLVDAGPGAFVRLGEINVNYAPMDTVLLTHLHIDHAGDLPGFVKSRDLASDGPLRFRIFGPSGAGPYPSTTAFVDRLFGESGAFAYLRSFRNDLRFEVVDLPTAPDSPVKELFHEGELRVTSIAVDHGETPAVAYRIEHAGHAAVFSGDLASKNENLARLAANADLLVYDTTVFDPPRSPKPLYDLHTPPHRIGEIAAAARVRSVLLSHVPPAIERGEGEVISAVEATFKGEVRFAEDCLEVDVMRRVP